MSEKRCVRCGDVKPLIRFPKALGQRRTTKERTQGRRNVCRACRKTDERRSQGARPLLIVREVAALRRIGELGRKRRREAPEVVLYSLLRGLLIQRCDTEGVSYDAVTYRARYTIDHAFRERECARQRAYKHANPEAVARWGDRRKQLCADYSDGTLTRAVLAHLFASAHLCPYCGVEMLERDKTLDHKEPVSRGGAHSIANVLVCCRTCNHEKHDMPYYAWLQRIRARAGLRERVA